MENNTIASLKENNGQAPFHPTRPKFGRRLSSSCETPRATNTKQFTFDSVTSAPSLEASLDCSSASDLADEHIESQSSDPWKASALKQTTLEPPSPTDEGCMTDRVVRFFCPFDTIQEDPSATQPTRSTNSNSQQGRQSNVYCSTANQDCTSGWAPVQICIPQQWENSPERTNISDKGLNIKNRCSTMDASQRKSEYIQRIRSQWHSKTDEAPLPLRSTRSEAVALLPKARPPISIRVPSNPEAFYDSDPEVPPSAPIARYKRNRPTSLNLDTLSTDHCDIDFPSVPRHSEQELNSFFSSSLSPKSVVLETPDFDDDDAVRTFVQVRNHKI